MTKYCYNRYKEEICSDWDVGSTFVGVGTGVVLLIGVIVIICQVFDIVTCFTFPEKIILDELASIYEL